jgi:DNA-binding Xre family transcriptional regulator
MVFAISWSRKMTVKWRSKMTIRSQLQAAIKATDATLYRIAKDADVDWGTLQRFLDGTRPNIRIDTVDRLCEALELELQPKKSHRSKRRTK